MTEYQKQAEDFLTSCNATMEIAYTGLEKSNLDDELHCAYDCTIKTPRGSMTVHFYDSAYNTEIMCTTIEKYAEKKFKCKYEYLRGKEKITARAELLQKQKEAKPTAYDILACLQKYEVGSMDDFMSEFGYEIHSVKDMTNFINTYNAVVEEYNNLCRIFTPEQMKMLREIQ